MRAVQRVSTPAYWRFGSAVFDEANWSLSVDGRRVAIEVKPLELLRELLRREGAVATKDELMDALWPDVSVVEASLTTAMLKLRRALGDDDRGERIIETVSRIGYRLAVTATRAAATSATDVPRDASAVHRPRRAGAWRLAALAGVIAVGAGGYAVTAAFRAPSAPAFTQRDALEALNTIDRPRLHALLAAGWNPNTPFDKDNNGALNALLAVCEWNPGHDREALMMAARMLYDAGARLDRRNAWGDTPYSIARATRYCGPDHPVTKMIRAICYSGITKSLNPKCLASYDLPPRSAAARPVASATQVTASR